MFPNELFMGIDLYMIFLCLAVVAAIDDEFDVEVPAKEIIPANFNSAASLTAMIQRLADEE